MAGDAVRLLSCSWRTLVNGLFKVSYLSLQSWLISTSTTDEAGAAMMLLPRKKEKRKEKKMAF